VKIDAEIIETEPVIETETETEKVIADTPVDQGKEGIVSFDDEYAKILSELYGKDGEDESR
jgi:hypothetical protein